MNALGTRLTSPRSALALPGSALGWAFLLVALVSLGAFSRVWNAAPNFTAIGAIALLAGVMLRSRALAVCVPIAAMLASDVLIGFYDWRLMLVVYAALAAPALLGGWLRARLGPGRLIAASLAGSTFFFVVTNFAVWMGGAYGLTWSGLAACYIAAVPFFKYTLAGDLLFGSALFTAWALASRAVRARRALAAQAA